MLMNRNAWMILGGFAFVVALQYLSFRSVSSELAVLRSELRASQTPERFLDPAASDQDRLRAFRLLRRNNQVNDETLSPGRQLAPDLHQRKYSPGTPVSI